MLVMVSASAVVVSAVDVSAGTCDEPKSAEVMPVKRTVDVAYESVTESSGKEDVTIGMVVSTVLIPVAVVSARLASAEEESSDGTLVDERTSVVASVVVTEAGRKVVATLGKTVSVVIS